MQATSQPPTWRCGSLLSRGSPRTVDRCSTLGRTVADLTQWLDSHCQIFAVGLMCIGLLLGSAIAVFAWLFAAWRIS